MSLSFKPIETMLKLVAPTVSLYKRESVAKVDPSSDHLYT